MPFLPLLVLLLHASAAHPRERPLSVRQVMENAEAYDGREIIVAGWVEECRRLDCTLYASLNEAQKDSPRYWLSIGRSRWFDAFVRRNGPIHVTMHARFDARCVTDPAEGIIAICAYRVNSLQPIALVT
jgi:hypothetical protein